MEIIIVLLVAALVGMVVMFIRERWAREDEVKKLTAQRKELRGWLAERVTKEQADLQRWTSMYSAYKSGWNDAVAAGKEADETEAEAEAAKVLAKAKAKAKAKADRLTMK